MAVVVGDNQGSGEWLAEYVDRCPRGMMTDEGMN